MPPVLFYCYDAYCGWCYGFSPVIKQIDEQYRNRLSIEVLSGGMILPDQPVHIGATATYIRDAYKTVEAHTGIKFGADYLWHIFNPEESDWYPNSEKPAIALCVFKTYFPDKQVQFAGDLQFALHNEGRDLTDDEAYRHFLEKYTIPADEFYKHLHSPEFREKAYYEFALVKQLRVTEFPAVLLQENEATFHLLARGYTPYDLLKNRLDQVLENLADKKTTPSI